MWKTKLHAVRSAYSRLTVRQKTVYAVAFGAVVAGCTLGTFTAFPDQESICKFDATRESQRAASAANFPDPQITAIDIDGVQSWISGSASVPLMKPGQTITLHGTGFGAGPDIDFTKIMLGNVRVLERDLTMYQQLLDQNKQINFETSTVADSWAKDVLSWNDTTIQFRVPVHASGGPLVVQIQKRTGYNNSLLHPTTAHLAIDAITRRITDTNFAQKCDVVSQLSTTTKGTTPIAVNISNPNFANMVTLGRQIYWSYDFNIGLAHNIRHLDWPSILNYKATDPITGLIADPALLFGAYRTNTTDMPSEASQDVYFDPYPQPTPIPGLLGADQVTKGNTSDTGWVGYRYAEASNPYTGSGKWIGFNCASCHSYKITYQNRPGSPVTKVIPGLPNPSWSMRWSVLGTMDGIKGSENGPSWATGSAMIDKTGLIYSMPSGAGEHALIRVAGDGSETANDYNFSPIAIPNVTNYLPIRRSLSHTESYAGFEGSYIHSEEPDGSTGAMRAKQLQALTAYMSTLNGNDNDLRNAGLYRWLSNNGKLNGQTGRTNLSEGEFVQAGWQAWSGVSNSVAQGKAVFQRDCASCHADNVGANTNERMFKLSEVGRFFAPTIYHKKQQAIRATFLRDLYWVQHRGLLSDGHVRNVEDLVNPQRCTEGSALYNQYYTVHAAATPALGSPDHPQPYPTWNRKSDVFRVPKFASTAAGDTGAQRNLFTERHKYFVTIPGDSNWYYWDYQKLRREYGPAELGTSAPIGMPAAPHPWCAANSGDTDALVEYLLTL